MSDRNIPNIFRLLLSDMCIDKPDIAGTSDGFFVVNKSWYCRTLHHPQSKCCFIYGCPCGFVCT